MRQVLLRLALLALLPVTGCAQPPSEGPAVARPQRQAQATPPGAAPLRMPRTLDQPLNLARPNRPTAGTAADPAPIPNRAIEAPPDRFANSHAASLEPFVLPPERRPGMTFGREHLRDTGPDRPFDNILPGARLRIPFEGSVGR